MNINALTERDFVVLLTEGNEEAFERLYHFYSKRLLGYLVRLVKSENFASELLQETFIKIWNNRQNINPDQSFRSYLFRIAENLVFDFFRKAAQDKKLQAALINSATNKYSHVEEIFCRKENDQLLRDAINALPSKRRRIFQLVKMEERSYNEVSTLLNISASTINDHVVKATKAIRENLEHYHITVIGILFLSAIIA
ncbi:MAG: RNA polymerase sigma-70 factor [Bacteroidota bacterium]